MKKTRRTFLKQSGQIALGMGLMGLAVSCDTQKKVAGNTKISDTTNPGDMFFKISLAQWSLHRSLWAKKLDNLDFAAKTKNDFGIDGIEYVNSFFKDKAKDKKYLKEMIKRADDNGVKSLIIMVDGEGGLADTDKVKLSEAVEKHYKWVDAAKTLGCHSIRVNSYGVGTREEVAKAAVEGLSRVAEYGAKSGMNVIVENHGGYSSDGKWLSDVMKEINMPNCGTLPDFGNFCLKRKGRECVDEYDRYQGVRDLMPFAKAVSAKSHVFDEEGNETNSDYFRIMKIVKEFGYRGYVGIEYEGGEDEDAGIMATKKLLEKVGKALS
ncbi:MAG: TIM barrel protein [Bacteroidetes bacterium]|nr:TIM barrel protein [Bacteroidota bacterium]